MNFYDFSRKIHLLPVIIIEIFTNDLIYMTSAVFRSKYHGDSTTLYDPVFVFVVVNHNSDDMKRYFCVKYQTAVDRWNLFALESVS